MTEKSLVPERDGFPNRGQKVIRQRFSNSDEREKIVVGENDERTTDFSSFPLLFIVTFTVHAVHFFPFYFVYLKKKKKKKNCNVLN